MIEFKVELWNDEQWERQGAPHATLDAAETAARALVDRRSPHARIVKAVTTTSVVAKVTHGQVAG